MLRLQAVLPTLFFKNAILYAAVAQCMYNVQNARPWHFIKEPFGFIVMLQ